MSYRIHFTLITYKQFNFCRFRASAYTNVDRLCAVFYIVGIVLELGLGLASNFAQLQN